MQTTTLAISFTDPARKNEAEALSDSLKLPLTDLKTSIYPLCLVFTSTRLELRTLGPEKLNPIAIDFVGGKLAHRHHYGGGRGQLIARALGLKSNPNPHVLDLTAGLGSDSFVLATLHCKVTMVERSPIVTALLQDGLTRAQQEPWFNQLELTLVHMEAKAYLQQLSHPPEIIYLDPMFPDSKKTALVKKEMRLLRTIVGQDEDANQLLDLSRNIALKRVVVKRSLHAKTLTTIPPDLQYKGKSSRFDVYLTPRPKS